jgi:hypothetical protein
LTKALAGLAAELQRERGALARGHLDGALVDDRQHLGSLADADLRPGLRVERTAAGERARAAADRTVTQSLTLR